MKAQGSDGHDRKLSIIAMKGHPFTRKTEFAEIIATFLGCPILSSEHVLCSLTPPITPEREDEAFMVICGIAHHHLGMGISKNIVIDSRLSSESHLIRLTGLASNLRLMQARVIVIECKAMNLYSWKMKIEKHKGFDSMSEWFKPKSWEDVEKAIKDHPDYDVMSVEGHEFVSKLVVDPLLDVPVDGINLSIPALHYKPSTTPRLVEAVRYMMTREQGDGPNVVVYRHWSSSLSSSSSTTTTHDVKQCSRDGHHLVMGSGLRYEVADCVACQKLVTRSHDADAYCHCKNCSLTLHMECAEAFNHKTSLSPFPPHVSAAADHKFCFPEEFACEPCRESGSEFSENCRSCLFETHLKCGLMPTVIKHFDTEEHFLTIVLKPFIFMGGIYLCAACGKSDRYNMYLCHDCGVAYHYKCVTLPRRVKHVHGDHHHTLSLKFKSEEAEDYLCLECLEFRDPALWFYSCEDCPGYDLHPYCVDVLQLLPRLVKHKQDDIRKLSNFLKWANKKKKIKIPELEL